MTDSSRLLRTFRLHLEAFRDTYGMTTALSLAVDGVVLAIAAYATVNYSGVAQLAAALVGLFILAHRAVWAVREVRG